MLFIIRNGFVIGKILERRHACRFISLGAGVSSGREWYPRTNWPHAIPKSLFKTGELYFAYPHEVRQLSRDQFVVTTPPSYRRRVVPYSDRAPSIAARRTERIAVARRRVESAQKALDRLL